ncbi:MULTISPECIES: dienelactone hydrolase family protein [Mycobacteroides]|uniref:Carboxymethylenebutenolidase n=1 Tax=Mycobacteroides chelonae TaxID=1774 RepID=A0A1S1LG27_MYCCH|nr:MULTISPECIES: dienelactone hydrolase family protein [Mycobacteroides]KRQ18291.1 carboxymethylenebutenolidase [Mycobacteroides sp. H003]KRQ25579.1 carboxymethylenebutenolidase [Mycobacteroides sp. H092]KRQ33631.1 carboxymethylenebutenolidase [Mycobacteroides sp. H101]KRQ45210.1 carboxymethylenebutenolidase [Mycobacteroides sp. H063]KRQ56249.1 carboxymethylenebutenolidase [Mycobacteroides sp. HXVII]
MADISFPTKSGEVTGILEKPAGDGPWPSIVVLHDINGSTPDLRRITKNVAANGYVALAPDLYSRGRIRCISRVMTNLITRRGRAIDEILAARDHLLSLPYTTGGVGVAGFCMGGGFVLITSTKGFDAAAPFYGAMPGPYGDHFEGACPVVASLATQDPFVIRGEPRLRKALDAHGIEHDIKKYDAGHSFANQLPMQPLMRIAGFGYSPEAEADAWERVYAFFAQHLHDDDRLQEAQ